MAGSGYKDYFQVLGVDRGADADTIKRAFRKLARQYHPDVNPGDQSAEARFKEISEAYEVLSDPDKRRKYEQFGQYWNQAGGMGGGAPGMDVDFGRYGNFDDFINDLLGRFGGPGGGGGGFQGSGFPGGGFPGGFPRADILFWFFFFFVLFCFFVLFVDFLKFSKNFVVFGKSPQNLRIVGC